MQRITNATLYIHRYISVIVIVNVRKQRILFPTTLASRVLICRVVLVLHVTRGKFCICTPQANFTKSSRWYLLPQTSTRRGNFRKSTDRPPCPQYSRETVDLWAMSARMCKQSVLALRCVLRKPSLGISGPLEN